MIHLEATTIEGHGVRLEPPAQLHDHESVGAGWIVCARASVCLRESATDPGFDQTHEQLGLFVLVQLSLLFDGQVILLQPVEKRADVLDSSIGWAIT